MTKKQPKKESNLELELKKIQYLLAGVLLKRNPTVKEIAKIIGCSDNMITKLYPNKQKNKTNSKRP